MIKCDIKSIFLPHRSWHFHENETESADGERASYAIRTVRVFLAALPSRMVIRALLTEDSLFAAQIP